MLADELDYVIGVDTHLDQHVLAIVVAPSGGVVAQRSVRASARGYAQAVRFADEHGRGARVWSVEGKSQSWFTSRIEVQFAAGLTKISVEDQRRSADTLTHP
jgi:hypothetical protein